jgi:hypothetical protein
MSLDFLGADIRTQAEQTFAEAEAKAKVVSAKVSPWLWVLSIGSFAMAVANRYQIGQMFGSFKQAKSTLWKK